MSNHPDISQHELDQLRTQLHEAQETLEAIRTGQVDAIVVAAGQQERIFTLQGAEHAYRVILENMNEGAATLTGDGMILYANQRFAGLLGQPLDKVLGSSLQDHVPPRDLPSLHALLHQALVSGSRGEIHLKAPDEGNLPALLSFSPLNMDGTPTVCLIATDLREQKRHEQVLAAEELARLILDQAAEPTVVCDERGVIIRASRTAHPLCGQNPLFRRFHEAFDLRPTCDQRSADSGEVSSPPANREPPFQLDNVLAGQTYQSTEACLFCPDGRTVNVLVNAGPLRDPAGHRIGCVIALADITERQRAEDALHRIEWLLTRSVKHHDGTRHASFAAPPYGDLSAEATSHLLLEHVGREMIEEILSDSLDLLDTSAAVYERNGDYAMGILSSGWCRMLDGASRGLCHTSDNRRALACGAWICHESCWNKASKPAIETGVAVDTQCEGGIHIYAVPVHAGGQVIGSLNISYGDPPSDPQIVRQIAQRYGVDPQELLRQAEAYESRPLFIIEIAKKRLETSAMLIGAIVERKQAEEQLQQLNQTLEQKVKERTAEARWRADQLQALAAQLTQVEEQERRRLATVLHDHLQQLLVGARFSTGILRHRIQGDETSMESLRQVDNLLDQSLQASRDLTVELSPPVLYASGLPDAVRWLADWMRDKHGLNIVVRADDMANPTSEEVRILLFQSIRELLFNVAKHAGVTAARVVLKPLGQDWLQAVVHDRGRGFDPEALYSKGQGSGFGLFSVRERLELLGGRMTIHSKPGKGVRVTLQAPRLSTVSPARVPVLSAAPRAPRVPPSPRPPVPDPHKIRILLVDDHAILRDGVARLLQTHPDFHVVAQASDGQEAVDLAIEHHPDVVVMDVSMPRMNGVEATRRLHQALPEARVIGLSMHMEPSVAGEMKAAGAVCYLAKSSGPNALVESIRTCAGRPAKMALQVQRRD